MFSSFLTITFSKMVMGSKIGEEEKTLKVSIINITFYQCPDNNFYLI